MFVLTSALCALAALPLVAAHSHVTDITIGATNYKGPHYGALSYADGIGWPTPENIDSGPIFPAGYAEPEIICNRGATPGPLHAHVKAGEVVRLQWGPFPLDHKGPIITYMANCRGSCADVQKETLEWVKIDAVGLVGTNPNRWATDVFQDMYRNWPVTVPEDLVDGNWTLRSELFALQGAHTLNGAQNYPVCINLEVSGGGSADPMGVVGTELYTLQDPGIIIDINTDLAEYPMPGPPLYVPGSGSDSTQPTPAGAAPLPSSTGTASVEDDVETEFVDTARPELPIDFSSPQTTPEVEFVDTARPDLPIDFTSPQTTPEVEFVDTARPDIPADSTSDQTTPEVEFVDTASPDLPLDLISEQTTPEVESIDTAPLDLPLDTASPTEDAVEAEFFETPVPDTLPDASVSTDAIVPDTPSKSTTSTDVATPTQEASNGRSCVRRGRGYTRFGYRSHRCARKGM